MKNEEMEGGGVLSNLPYSITSNSSTTVSYNFDLVKTIRVGGIPFETLDNQTINSFSSGWLYSLNTLLKNKNISLWTHIVRRKVKISHENTRYNNDFSKDFSDQYYKTLGKEDEFINELFLSPVYRASPTRLDKYALSLTKKNPKEMKERFESNHEDFQGAVEQLLVSIRQYHPTLLASYDSEGFAYSKQSEFLSKLLNHDSRKIPFAKRDLSMHLLAKELSFGEEMIELSGNASSEFAAVLALNVPYEASQIDSKVLSGLLSSSFEYVLSQSIITIPFSEADKILKAQYNNILSTTANSIELNELKDTRERLQAGMFNMLKHEFTLLIYGDDIKSLNKNVNKATAILDQKGLGVSRLKRGVMLRSFYNILPANFIGSRKRVVSIRDEAFVMMFPMHNHPTGNRKGSQWGVPIATMRTSSNTPYFFNYHVARSRLEEQGLKTDFFEEDENKENKHRKEVGNYQIIGRTGSGKTVIKMALRILSKKTMANGQRLKTFSFDKDYGEKIGILAMGGEYFEIVKGVSCDINLFSLPNNASSAAFIHGLLKWCVQHESDYIMGVRDDQDLMKAIKNVFSKDESVRRLRTVRHYLNRGDENSLYNQLGRWCDSGSMAWLLDGNQDKFNLDTCEDFGFDMTEVLDNSTARTPLLSYLTYKIGLSTVGTPHIIDIAEAWKALSDPYLEKFILNKSKTIRKEGGIIGLDTQDPEDISKSDISAAILSQFPTMIVLPNSTATEKDYMGGLHLSRREFDIVKSTPEGTGQFLIKKGNESVLVKMDLGGMDDMLAIISSSTDNVKILEDIIEEVGSNPVDWLPTFKERRV